MIYLIITILMSVAWFIFNNLKSYRPEEHYCTYRGGEHDYSKHEKHYSTHPFLDLKHHIYCDNCEYVKEIPRSHAFALRDATRKREGAKK